MIERWKCNIYFPVGDSCHSTSVSHTMIFFCTQINREREREKKVDTFVGHFMRTRIFMGQHFLSLVGLDIGFFLSSVLRDDLSVFLRHGNSCTIWWSNKSCCCGLLLLLPGRYNVIFVVLLFRLSFVVLQFRFYFPWTVVKRQYIIVSKQTESSKNVFFILY